MAAPTTITGPLHAHGVKTAKDYLLKQAAHIRDLQNARPDGPWGAPHPVTAPVDALVSGGRWVVVCPCGNAPSASPDWQLACCFECGAIYHPTFPVEREALEALLLARPVTRTRNWAPPESVADLTVENAVNGAAFLFVFMAEGDPR